MDNEHQSLSSSKTAHRDNVAQSDNMQDKYAQHSNPHGEQAKNEQAESRFSRRRFLRSSAAVSPVLLSLKSPTAWGSGLGGQNCSIMLSGNASNPQNCISEPLAPREWKKILNSRRDSPQYPLRQSLQSGGVSGNSAFNGKFLRPFNQWRYSPTKGWMFKVSFRKSSNPKFKHTLKGGLNKKYKITIAFKPTSQKNKNMGDDFVITLEPRHFHQTVVAAYLNSYFTPGLISYSYYPEQINTSVVQTMMDVANLIMDELNKGKKPNNQQATIHQPFTRLVRDLARWT
ncbi:hypothetical protein A3K86_15025 [Photobacterium jeanii]|uniref:Uncharacterized protein n=1 Tax=Photobacterium jeanii TaxID=858640 RepID=A0A178K6S4_9GAMM|nr:hypothetical protein [Photobacterium jeanii]OAN12981.1 hypothetical protein A3K86_15025 [Photobacterium jeanii]PST89128.1 hypothetical protein C9I91_13470 [Photobacterium jeanii]